MLANNPNVVTPVAPPRRKPQPSKIERHCQWCRNPFQARAADVKRGWAKFCSKSCKASEQEKRTGQHRAHTVAQIARHDVDGDARAMDDCTGGWDEGGWRKDESGCSPF